MIGRHRLAVLSGMLFSVLITGCLATSEPSAPEGRGCTVGRLDAPDLAALFDDPAVSCVLVAWDTGMDGAGPDADGGVGTPAALVAAARTAGFASPCETVVGGQKPSPHRAWFISRFGVLDPEASDWGVTFFARAPLPDGVHPGCSAVTPTP